MTIGSWVVLGILAACGVGIAVAVVVWAHESYSKKSVKIGYVVGAVVLAVTVVLCYILFWYRSNSESGRRALKDQQANLHGGIERTVTVYDIDGEIIEQYSGKFDIETDRQSYILFDDEQGKRHIIYYTTGTIIVDEK